MLYVVFVTLRAMVGCGYNTLSPIYILVALDAVIEHGTANGVLAMKNTINAIMPGSRLRFGYTPSSWWPVSCTAMPPTDATISCADKK